MSSYQELKEQANELLRQAEELRAGERNEVLIAVRNTVAEWGFTANEIGFKPSKDDKTAKKHLPAKYRNADGKEWCGRGAAPLWLRNAIANGANKNDFLIAA
jgi:DNA-binding protein H-NS